MWKPEGLVNPQTKLISVCVSNINWRSLFNAIAKSSKYSETPDEQPLTS